MRDVLFCLSITEEKLQYICKLGSERCFFTAVELQYEVDLRVLL